MASLYHYDPLSSPRHTRLLLLHPSQDHFDALRCSIEELHVDATADTQRDYDALSYVWGERTGSRPLLCGDETILITPNCESALRRLRHCHDIRTLWVDAICIDQSNVLERNSQVRMMSGIYAQASAVFVWLGESDSDIDYALSLLSKVDVPEELEAHVGDDVLALGVRKLLGFEWWERTWVLQEFAVAKDDPVFVCGHTSLSWKILHDTLEYLLGTKLLVREESPLSHFMFKFEKGRILRELELFKITERLRQFDHVELYGFLGPVRQRKAADPRDQVFAILGLLPQEHPLQPILDYSLSVEEVYTQATLQLFKDAPDMDHLTLSAAKGSIKLPSWCIDFTVAHSVSRWNESEKFRATGQATASEISYVPEARTLKLSGTVMGTIKSLQAFPGIGRTDTRRNIELERERVACYLDFVENALEVMSASAIGRDRSMMLMAKGAFWKAVDIGETVWTSLSKDLAELSPTSGWWMVESWFCQYTKFAWDNLLPKLPDNNLLDDCVNRYAAQALASSIDSTMIVTDEGRLGRVDGYGVVEGDIVCVLFGCWKPAVLRKHGGVYEIVSFAWMPDFMHGEAITDDMIVEEFVLE